MSKPNKQAITQMSFLGANPLPKTPDHQKKFVAHPNSDFCILSYALLSTSQGAIFPSRDSRGPHQAPQKMKNTPQINRFPLERSHTVKVKFLRPKICQTIHPPHPQASSTSQGAISPSHYLRDPIRPPKGQKTPNKLTVFP